MTKKTKSIINAVISLSDENTELKHKLSILTGKDNTKDVENGVTNKFAHMCYERGLNEIIQLVESRIRGTGQIKLESSGIYTTYEEWINRLIDGYNNPFNTYDTRFLLKEFSINELLAEMDPWLHKMYEKELEIARLNDLKESK